MTIIINGDPILTNSPELNYEDIVELAGKKGYPTVTYSSPRLGDSKRSGEMHFGSPAVPIEDQMIFSVVHTGHA